MSMLIKVPHRALSALQYLKWSALEATKIKNHESQIRKSGIAYLDAELALPDDLYHKIKDKALKFKNSVDIAENSSNFPEKPFMSIYYSRGDTRSKRYDSDEPMLEVAQCACLQEYARLLFKSVEYEIEAVNYWYQPENQSPEKERTASQNWHFDPYHRCLKVFIYFNKVDDTATEIVPNCKRWNLKSKKITDIWNPGFYIGERQKDMEFTQKKVKATGDEGSMYIIDSSNLHRGGFGKGERLMGTISYRPI